MAFPNDQYAPPGVYTQTNFENPLASTLASVKVPVMIGEGNESLFQRNLEVVRGSSKSVDIFVPQEDETGRAVVSISQTGQVTLGDFDGIRTRFRVRQFPIVTGDGTATTTNNRSDVQVTTTNNQPLVVLSVDGARGIIELAQPPAVGQVVRCSYYFDRTDTLATDNVSDQVTPTPALIRAVTGIIDANSPNQTGPQTPLTFYGDVLNSLGQVVVPANNVLLLTVDGVGRNIVIPPRTGYTMAQVASAISAAAVGTLTASTFVNQYGMSALSLSADFDITVGAGSANALLGLVEGASSNRTNVFYVFNGPITDGSNGGVTTTDTAHVTVKVDGRQVIPTKVDGTTRAVTLPYAPKAGSTVAITYYWNTWQDTFDYLANIGVSQITACGFTPGGSDYIQGADFILKDDKVVWGTASLVAAGVNTSGSEFFNESKITPVLVDNKTFLSPCDPIVDVTTGVASARDFTLPFQPTLGNGRDTSLGQSLFQSVSNGRIDLPVNRPDVIDAYWGYDVPDALARGKINVTKVDGLVITLESDVPVGANVYATFYYNRLVDQEYTLTCTIPGVSGVGQYTIQDNGANDLFNAKFPTSSKGSSLNGVTIEFPSGSELTPDLRHEGLSGSDFIGPVEETVTVQFASRWAGPARFSLPGSAPYQFIPGQSDRLRIQIDGSDLVSGLTGASLNAITTSTSAFGSLLGNEIAYTGGTGATVGLTYSLDSDETVSLLIDGSDVEVTVPAANNVNASVFVDRINEAASGHSSTAAAGAAANTEIVLNATPRSSINGYYVGWVVVIGNGAAGAVAGTTAVVTAYNGSTGVATVGSSLGGIPLALDPYHIYNPTARSYLKGATKFSGPVTITAGQHDDLQFTYIGTPSGTFTDTITITAGTYASVAALVTEIETQLAASIGGAGAAFAGLDIECSADADGRLQFAIQLPGADSAGSLQFLNAASVAQDFAILAGLDTAAASGGGQAALIQAPVAVLYTVTSGGVRPYDRIILRNRILSGGGANSSMAPASAEAQTGLVVRGGTGLTKAGLEQGSFAEATAKAVVRAATIAGEVVQDGGYSANSELQVTFYDGTGSVAANNQFAFTMDGVAVNFAFIASATGTVTPLGPITTATTVLGQIAAAMAAVAGQPFGNAAAIIAARYVRQEGLGIRLTSSLFSEQSVITVGSGSANAVLGFTAGTTVQRTLVTAKALASAVMGQRHATFSTLLLGLASSNTYFFDEALAGVIEDAAGAEYLYLQSRTVGTSSQVRIRFTSVGGIRTQDATFPGTGLDVQDSAGDIGEAAINGFFVTSNVVNGSGSANDSILNNGTGSDGVIGQTYRDAVTGLTFTILPRGFQTNSTGPWVAYPTGANATFRVQVSKTVTCDANLPITALPGVELKVANTFNVAAGDTGIVSTFKRGGNEPAIGDLYYVSYIYEKQDYNTQFFTKMSSIEAAFGSISPDNPVSLASYLAILNGAILIGIKQVKKAEGSQQGSLESYRAAIEDLEGVQPGQVAPDLITPLRGDSLELFQILKKSNAIMSSIRYRSERTSIIGLSAGTLPDAAQRVAEQLRDTRMRLVYPDIVTVDITDAFGRIKEYLVDGTYLAAAMTGSVVSPNYDVATPWTNRLLTGFNSLARILDAVEMNQIAVSGVTVLEQRGNNIRVRHGLTTDMTNQLTKLPTIIQIADEVQRQARATLERFIGLKYLPGIASQVEGRLSMMFKNLVAAQIVAAYTGVKATPDAEDPTLLNVEAYYSPIFPLLYIVITFNLRSRLAA
jgi:hypothetical protein